jgi:hypothetical protein
VEKYIQKDNPEYEALREQYANSADPLEKEQIRALGELLVLKQTLDLTDGDPSTKQLGGLYGNVKGKLPGYHAHHIPPKSVSDHNINHLPAICMIDTDHRMTSSYGNRMGALFSPEKSSDSTTYKERLIRQINEGNYADAFKNEVYEIKMKFGDKYDGAIKQAIDANASYLMKYGNPKVNKGIEAAREKMGTDNSTQPNPKSNKGIKSFQAKTSGQTIASNQRDTGQGQSSGNVQGR